MRAFEDYFFCGFFKTQSNNSTLARLFVPSPKNEYVLRVFTHSIEFEHLRDIFLANVELLHTLAFANPESLALVNTESQ